MKIERAIVARRIKLKAILLRRSRQLNIAKIRANPIVAVSSARAESATNTSGQSTPAVHNPNEIRESDFLTALML